MHFQSQMSISSNIQTPVTYNRSNDVFFSSSFSQLLCDSQRQLFCYDDHTTFPVASSSRCIKKEKKKEPNHKNRFFSRHSDPTTELADFLFWRVTSHLYVRYVIRVRFQKFRFIILRQLLVLSKICSTTMFTGPFE